MSKVITGSFPARHVPPKPKLVGDQISDEALPHFLMGTSLCSLVAEAQRLRITHGKDAALWALDQVLAQVQASE